MEVAVGLRVVRGPDWALGGQDGGEGRVGTVVEVHAADQSDKASSANAAVTVQWDGGSRSRCRCGVDGKYDLRVLDSAPTGVKHPNVSCDGCGQASAMTGIRWKCARCFDYDLCTPCYMAGNHSLEHEFTRYDTPRVRTRAPPRRDAEKVEAKGIFPGAEVVRGHDWTWENQDGGAGSKGKVLTLKDWNSKSHRSAVDVEWTNGMKNIYQVGRGGMVDLECTIEGTGGFYYPDHLVVLGAPYVPPGPREFAVGDYIKVELDLDVFELMQEGHGGWNPIMAIARGQVGVVHSILDSGDLKVQYAGDKSWIVNPDSIVKEEIPLYSHGDVVRIMDDMAEVKKLQQRHGEWNDDMSDALGHLGVVEGVNSSGNVIVTVKGHVWVFNPMCVSLAPDDEKPPEWKDSNDNTDSIGAGVNVEELQLKMFSLLSEESSEFLLYAALLGSDSSITEYLQKFPNEVNAQFNGKAAIHAAAWAGSVPVLQALLDFGANLELEGTGGKKPLHLCAERNKSEVAKLLLDAGANANSKTATGMTPLFIAIARGAIDVLKVLVNHPTIDLSVQDSDGDTALHLSIHARKHALTNALLEAGADVTLVNFKLDTPLQLAIQIGSIPAVEGIIGHYPQYINTRGEENCSPLHIAAFANNRDIVTFLVNQESCEIDARADKECTPLHVAALKGRPRIIECLVGYGANLNVADTDGDTPLHLVLDREVMAAPSADTPELLKVKDQLGEQARTDARVVVACFLIQEGADVHAKNKKGVSPLEACPSAISEVVADFAKGNTRSGSFHGSLRSQATATDTTESEPERKDSKVVAHESVTEMNNSTTEAIPEISPQTEEGTQQSSATEDAPHPVAIPNFTSLAAAAVPKASPLAEKEVPQPATVPKASPLAEKEVPQPATVPKSSPLAEKEVPQPATVPKASPLAEKEVPQPATVPKASPLAEKEVPQPATVPKSSPLAEKKTPLAMASTLSSDQPSVASGSEGDRNLCCLCDTPITVKFAPCGHSVVCEFCAKRAMKCPECKARIQAVVNLNARS